MSNNARRHALLAAASSTILFAGSAAAAQPLTSALTLDVGKNAVGDPCRATRSFDDRSIKGSFDAAFVITCRNVTASRSVGVIRSVVDRPGALEAIEATLSCGAASPAMVGSLRATVRRCFDSSLASETVVISARTGDRRLIGSANQPVLGPLERGMRALAGERIGGNPSVPSRIDINALAPAPLRSAAAAAAFDPEGVLRQVIELNRKGRHIEASRIANDALSRLPASASMSMRAELSLEAALADSNIRFTQTAAEQFARADALLSNTPDSTAGFLPSKRDTYKTLDLINRGQYGSALEMLDRVAGPAPNAAEPLEDLALISILNQPTGARGAAARSVSVPNARVLDTLLLRAQANWARSVALLARGDIAGAASALDAAQRNLRPFQSGQINRAEALWMEARIESQRARLAARRSDWINALAAYDRAAAVLRQSAISSGSGMEPAMAQLLLERASVLARKGAPVESLRQEYGRALNALIEAGMPGGAPPIGLDRYLDLLVDGSATDQARQEEFFRALQAVGKPALERQMNQMRNVLLADPQIGAKLRDKADLERTLTALRYQIADLGTERAADVAALEQQRRAAQERLDKVDGELAANPRVQSLEDRPATLAEVRAVLRPGEIFWKVAEAGHKAYGILIAADATIAYRSEAPSVDIQGVGRLVRDSIDGQVEKRGKLLPFDVAASYTLFRLLAGAAADRLVQAQAIVVDPAGPLERLPAGVLVTDRSSVERQRRKSKEVWDYSDVAFLASRAVISTVVSPRSFLVLRALPPSSAPKPFIGFAEHSPGSRVISPGRVEVGSLCSVELNELHELAARLKPIDRSEVVIAADAIGAPGSPVISGPQFNDTALVQEGERGDLAQYKVLHFATHGLEEGVWGCSKSPPALVTSFGDGNSDGLLSFDEVAQLHLDANLVVMSACDTGSGIRGEQLARQSGQEDAGSTLQGLVRAFFTARSRAVMATHWAVSDEKGTHDFFRTFYRTAASTNVGSALRAAKMELIRQPLYSHPFYWGPFFLVGDGSKQLLSGRPALAAASSGRAAASVK